MENTQQPEPQSLQPQPPSDSLIVVREPGKVLKEAIRAAECLKKIIDAKPHKIILNGEVYLENEDWLTVARFYGVTSRIKSTRYVSYGDGEYRVQGFEAIADAYLVERSEVISSAESMCLSDETNWRTKPLFQLRSMAQTRASSRVLRQVFGWVVVLAGYKPTPAEEMQAGAAVHQKGYLCYECGEDVTEKERDDTRKAYSKTLCRVCVKVHQRQKEGQVMQPIHDPQFVRKSVAAVRGKNPQPVVAAFEREPDDLAGD